MIDFDEELTYYKPSLEIEAIEDAIINDEVVMEDYMKELEDETGVIIKCGN